MRSGGPALCRPTFVVTPCSSSLVDRRGAQSPPPPPLSPPEQDEPLSEWDDEVEPQEGEWAGPLSLIAVCP